MGESRYLLECFDKGDRQQRHMHRIDAVQDTDQFRLIRETSLKGCDWFIVIVKPRGNSEAPEAI